jgi:CBS-domain-containing membrane protein
MPDLELSDEDILDAMRRIPGYIDITTSDFREVYRLAHTHALDRLFDSIRAGTLMRIDVRPLRPDMRMDQAARTLVAQDMKSLPVVDRVDRVVGVLTESDFLHRLQSDSCLGLLLRLVEDPASFSHRCHETPVAEAMTAPAVTVTEDARFRQILAAFRAHPGRSMPVTDAAGRLRGVLLRKDFIARCGADGAP